MSYTDRKTLQNAVKISTLLLASVLFAGCHSKKGPTSESDALAMQAKAAQQAAATGSPQTYTTINSAGQTVTTTVQPPLNGAPGAVTSVVTGANPDAVTSEHVGPNAGGQPLRNESENMATNGGNNPPSQAAANPAAPANIDVPAGTVLNIRINQHISVKTSQPGDSFSGSIASPVVQNNAVVIPQGADVEGVVASAHKRGRFKGASILQLRLTSLTMNGQKYPLDTRDLTRTKKGKGKRSLAFIGGGTGLGMLIGGVASGGTGLLIGGLAGAGAGTGVAAFTGNRDINIPAESIVTFKLADDLVIQQ